MTDVPAYRDLPTRESSHGVVRVSWDYFGVGDQVGAANFLEQDQVRRAAMEIRDGTVISLNLEQHLPSPPLFGRKDLKHRLVVLNEGQTQDDVYHSFYPQGSSQWDSFRHRGDRVIGYYGGRSLEISSDPDGGDLGIEHIANRGIAARGVLLDLPRYFASVGRSDVDGFSGERVGVEMLNALLARQRITLERGDILCLRTGWLDKYRSLPQDEREAVTERSTTGKLTASGFAGDLDLVAYLWDAGVVAVASDNPALQASPDPEQEVSLHDHFLTYLGIYIGELWSLDAWAEACDLDGRYAALLTSAPLNLVGGVGSPANALVIR